MEAGGFEVPVRSPYLNNYYCTACGRYIHKSKVNWRLKAVLDAEGS